MDKILETPLYRGFYYSDQRVFWESELDHTVISSVAKRHPNRITILEMDETEFYPTGNQSTFFRYFATFQQQY